MIATTDQKARMFDLVTGVTELFRDGNRDPEEVLKTLQIIKGHRDFMPVLRGTAKPNLRYDKRPAGWTLIDHVPRHLVSTANLKLVPFLHEGEDSVRGYDLIGRARYKLGVNFGQEDAEFLLDHQAEIPEEFRQYYLVFTGTIWLDSDGRLSVPYLQWDEDRWILCWYWFDLPLDSRGRLIRPRK